MSSDRARVPIPLYGAYSASKAALEGFAGALAAEVEGFGVMVSVLELGSYRSAIREPIRERLERSGPGLAIRDRHPGLARPARLGPARRSRRSRRGDDRAARRERAARAGRGRTGAMSERTTAARLAARGQRLDDLRDVIGEPRPGVGDRPGADLDRARGTLRARRRTAHRAHLGHRTRTPRTASTSSASRGSSPGATPRSPTSRSRSQPPLRCDRSRSRKPCSASRWARPSASPRRWSPG